MSKRHFPGETIGIIGSSITSALLAQTAGALGYRVASLVTAEENPVRQFASWQTLTESYNPQALTFFAERVDLVATEVGILTNADLQLLASLTDLTLSDNLMAMTTDRLIEKSYLDSRRCLVPPFSLVTTLPDVTEAVESIGFPAVLKSSQRHVEGADDHVMLYSEEDYPAAEEKLNQGACILEAWIPAETTASLTILRNERGEILIYPAFEVVDLASGRQRYQYPIEVEDAVTAEMNRLAQLVAESLDLRGSLTLSFLVTSANVVYITSLSIGLGEEAMFTLGSMSLSQFEGASRAMMGLPLPELELTYPAAIAYPIEDLNQEAVLTQYMLRTDWAFALFNPIGNPTEQLTGFVTVTGKSIDDCLLQVDVTDITK